MRKLLAVVTGIAVVLAIVSTSLWRELRSERVLFADLRSRLTAAAAAARTPTPTSAVIPAPIPAAVVAATATTTPACKPTTPLPTLSLQSTDSDRLTIQSSSVTERDLLKDPEYRKARFAQRRLDIERSNPGVAEALGLSEKEADKFFNLLAEGQLRMNELPLPNASVIGPQAANEEMTRSRQALQKLEDEALAAQLGSNGIAQWQEYQSTRGARSQAVSFGSQLLQMGLPLTSAQMKPLTAALVAEQQRQRLDPQPAPRIVNNADPQARAAFQEEARKRTEESNRRLLAAIAPALNAQQLAIFREQFESQAAIGAATARARDRVMAARGIVQ